MARVVEEIMNRELFNARPDDRVDELLEYFAALGIGASPVLDRSGDLVGMVSMRDLVRASSATRVKDLMTSPAVTLRATCPIEEAARVLGETGYHRFPVLDEGGRVVGIVSSVDVIRGLVGIPAAHPETFPHYDADTGLTWTDDVPFDLDHARAADAGTGVIAIVCGGAGAPERVVWAELSDEVGTRLVDMLSLPQEQFPALQYWLEKPHLRFRTAEIVDKKEGRKVVDKLQRRAGYALF